MSRTPPWRKSSSSACPCGSGRTSPPPRPTHPIALGAYASSIGFDVAETEPGEQAAGRLRLGTDEGAEICVDATGRVQAVFVQADAPSMHVSSGVEAFAASLLTLDEYLPVLASPGRRNPAEVFREMRGRLLEIDAAAHEDDEAWWPRVLEQIRHALSFPFSAAFEVVEPDGRKHIETEQAQVGLPHPEQMLWAKLEARGCGQSRSAVSTSNWSRASCPVTTARCG
ncbi:MAG: hypothetical protein BUE48_003775 [Thermomonospora sp. CIF 1]|nr:MAG: hypothetical protein BUE48_003775 [Thermomonospora sp. CIF 1]